MTTKLSLLAALLPLTVALAGCDPEGPDAADTDELQFRSVSTFDALLDFDANTQGNDGWYYLYDSTGNGDYVEMNVGATFWGHQAWRDDTCTEASFTADASAVYVHPASVGGCSGWATLAWEAPAAGLVDFAVSVQEAHECTQGTAFELRDEAGTLLFSNGDTSWGVLYEHDGIIPMDGGERLYLRVHQGPGGTWCDTTALTFETSLNTSELVGHWTFEPGEETVDISGHWENLMGANVQNGQLVLDGNGTSAHRFVGDDIREKTLVSWVAIDDLNTFGSALSIDTLSIPYDYDGIVYGHNVAQRWEAGSYANFRTQNVVTNDETAEGQFVQMAVAYRDLGNDDVEITICRDGVQVGQYVSGNMFQWQGSNAEVVFGKIHTQGGLVPGNLQARIEEARIYDAPLSCAEVASLTPQ